MNSSQYRPELPEVPDRMRLLPIRRGYPVPWFVAIVDGDYHFPTADGRKFALAVKKRLCWVCGQPLGKTVAFVIGPMCVVNRTTSEPPCHRECAVFSATACPFLVRPHMKRSVDVPEDAKPPAGIALDRNPGAMTVWLTRDYWLRPVRAEAGVQGGYLFRIGPPVDVLWFSQGRAATREEVMASIESGLPLLRRVAEQEEGGVEALEEQYQRALPLLPVA
jgi:hypothetical protein